MSKRALTKLTQRNFVNDHETRKDSLWIENNKLLEIRVDSSVPRNGIIRHVFLLRRRVLHHALHSARDHATHQHGPARGVTAHHRVVGPTAAGGGSHALRPRVVSTAAAPALETVPDDGADAAAGYGGAEGGRATCTQCAR